MDFPETLNYLYTRLPVFQRVGASAYKANLDNTLKLCAVLGDPQQHFRSIHVAGTNGKGSTSHMIAAVLQCAGYKTGLYTSPHLKEFTERIRIDGREVEKEFVVEFVERMRPALESIQPSFFEATVVMAFQYFVQQKVDVAVIEVGLGGRLDSTNVITPLVSLITNIGYDHMDLLGETLPLIASEKAGIIKPGVPAVISERQPEVESVFKAKASEQRAPLFFATDAYRVEEHTTEGERTYDVYHDRAILYKALRCELAGAYQRENLSGVLMTLDQLRRQGFTITEEAIRQGIGKVVSLTGLKGRWQKISERPLMICDTAHNEAGMRAVMKQIRAIPYKRLFVILGMVKDKDIRSILNLLPKEAFYYFCQAKIPRAMPAAELAARAAGIGLPGEVVGDVNEAIRHALEHAAANDFIFVGGSTFVVAEINNL